jgi:glucosamine--fructose-6-phosphate aminotransferase (isomerizing)
MCGIVGYVGKDDAAKRIAAGLERLTYRGYDSCGIAVLTGRTVVMERVVGPVEGLPIGSLLGAGMGIGHTRWATHGAVTVANSHPHLDCLGKIAVVHNGTIENYEELKRELEEQGHSFRSETDTEVVAHLLESLSIWGALPKLKGSYALLVLRAKTQKLIAACYRCPLIITKLDDGGVVLSSSPVVSGEQYVMRDGEVLEIDGEGVVSPAVETRMCVVPDMLRNQQNCMLDEIREQPDVLDRVARTDGDLLRSTAIDLLRSEQVVFTASGTSRFAALVGRYLISRGTGRLWEVVTSSEFPYFADSLRRGMTVVAVSQSGETADIVEGARAAKEAGAGVVAITNYPGSMLGRLCDRVLDIQCGPEYGVAATKTFTGELALFYLLAGAIRGELDKVRGELGALALKVGQMLKDSEESVKRIAAMTKSKNDFYYLGRGINFAVAGEAALKMKEVSYIHAEGMAAGELKHGTLALVEEGTLVCGLCPGDRTYEDMMLNLREVKARKGVVIGISDRPGLVYDSWVPVPEVPEIYYPVVCAVAAQMIAYWAAVERGINPARPRNLAKAVVVR